MQSKEEDTVAMEDSQAHSLRNAQKGEKALRLRLDDVTLERVSSVFRVEARCFLLDPTNQTCVFANDDGSFGDQLTANAVYEVSGMALAPEEGETSPFGIGSSSGNFHALASRVKGSSFSRFAPRGHGGITAPATNTPKHSPQSGVASKLKSSAGSASSKMRTIGFPEG